MAPEQHVIESALHSRMRLFPRKRIFKVLFRVKDHGLYCLFDYQRESYHDKKTLQAGFRKALHAVQGTDPGLQLLKKMEALDSTDFSLPIINEIESIAREAGKSPEMKFLVDCFLATILYDVVSRARRIPPPSQLLNYLLYYFAEQQPEFLLLIDSFITIILNEERVFSRELIQLTAEVATLNYTPQILHIYTARNPLLNDKQKNTLFQTLTAYEKIKRLLSLYQQSEPLGAMSDEDFYQQRESKDAVARNWFGMSYAEVKSDQELFASADVKRFIKRFISQVRHKHRDQAVHTARALVLSVNDEDTIRLMNDIINNDPECALYRNDNLFINRAYRMLHAVMQDYRRICEKNVEDERMHRIIGQMALESRESLLQFLRAQYLSGSPSTNLQPERACRPPQAYDDGQGRTGAAEPLPPPPRDDRFPAHAPLEDTYRNLVTWSLVPLFEVYPIPPEAQQLFNTLCTIGNLIPRNDRTDKLHFLLYIEKIVELLQQIESLGIKIIIPDGADQPVIYNCFQLSTQGVVKKEDKSTYLVSTGSWREHNKTRPGVFKIFGPCSMTNCAGNYTVSLGLQILTSSGQFYAAPMALDHTLRYPQDYELQETCRDRPGWIPVRLPGFLRWNWEEVQRTQLATTNLLQIIEETIQKANDPVYKEFVPMGNIDGVWDA